MFLKNICYHIRAVDALGFHGAILFSGHSGPHRLDVPIVLDIMQAHVGVRLYSTMSVSTDVSRFDDEGAGRARWPRGNLSAVGCGTRLRGYVPNAGKGRR